MNLGDRRAGRLGRRVRPVGRRGEGVLPGEPELLPPAGPTPRAEPLGARGAHAIMGPNGSVKSTLAKVLAGHPGYEVTSGTVMFRGSDLLELEVDELLLQSGDSRLHVL